MQPGTLLKIQKWYDDYFYVKPEERGMALEGFSLNDDLNSPNKKEMYKFIHACTHSVIPSYIPLVAKNKDKTYTKENKQWQRLR